MSGITYNLSDVGIERHRMPQIKSEQTPEFFTWLQSQGIPTIKKTVKANLLKPIQKDINLDKIKQMIASAPEDALSKPIISSKDFYILDGHHRWVALINKNPNYVMDTYQVQCDIKTLLKLASRAPMVSYKTIHESFIDRVVREAIELDIEIGDEIRVGKFRNKKVIVKKIGTDEHGSPTVNGKSILAIRIPKVDPTAKKKEKEELAEAILREADFVELDNFADKFDQNKYGFIMRDVTSFLSPASKIHAVEMIEDAKHDKNLPTITLDPSMLMNTQGNESGEPFAVKLNRVFYLISGQVPIRQLVKDGVKKFTVRYLNLDI